MWGVVSDVIDTPCTSVSVADMERQVNYNMLDDGDRLLMQGYIDAAFIYAEKITRQTLHKRRIQLVGGFDSTCIVLPATPFQSVESITYLDSNGDNQTFTDYLIDKRAKPYQLYPYNAWPSTDVSNRNPVTIQYLAGYQGNNQFSIPATLLVAIRQIAATYWQNRESVSDMAMIMIPMHTESILLAHRIFNIRV